MIRTVIRTSWIEFTRDRAAQSLSFILPIVFFTVFAIIFGGMAGNDVTSRIHIAVVDEDHSEASRRVVDWLRNEGSLQVTSTMQSASSSHGGEPDELSVQPLNRETAEHLVKTGELPVAVILPEGFEAAIGFFGMSSDTDGRAGAEVELLVDRADPVASQAVAGLLQGAVMTAVPDIFMSRGIDLFETFGGPLTPSQRSAIDTWLPQLRDLVEADTPSVDLPDQETDGSTNGPASDVGFIGPVRIKSVDVMAADNPSRNKSPIIAYYAAGTGVMFLLFTVIGAASVLLDYEENGVLERLLSSNLSMTKLMVGRWIFITLLGVAQVFVMFAWGWLFFDLDLWTIQHFSGFLIMAFATAASAAALGLVFASACRSRAQLQGLSTIIILTMSAIGGSMFPRFLMPELMQKFALVTFNAWALDGFRKVFWFERPLVELWPQVTVLAVSTITFLLISRLLARRWETV